MLWIEIHVALLDDSHSFKWCYTEETKCHIRIVHEELFDWIVLPWSDFTKTLPLSFILYSILCPVSDPELIYGAFLISLLLESRSWIFRLDLSSIKLIVRHSDLM